ncbi:MAG: hypothetical protein WA958_02230 [Tunicatimonas sp.]
MKISTYPTLSGYSLTYDRFKAAVLSALFLLGTLPTLAQTADPIEIRLQAGETVTQQVTVINPGDAAVGFQTKVKETTASLARRTVAPTSFDGLDVLFSTGFEDYPVGDFNTQNGWVDKVLAEYPNFTFGNSIPVEATVSTTEPLNGERHLAYVALDTNQVYDSYSPPIEPAQTSPIRSAVVNVKLTSTESLFRIFTYQNRSAPNGNPQPPRIGANIVINRGGRVTYLFGANSNSQRFAPFTFEADQEYVEARFVVNRITKKFDVYLNGQRVVEAASTDTDNAVVDGIGINGNNNLFFNLRPFGPVDPTLYVDDITIAEGDASTPGWISTTTTTGTLPAQGESALDVTVNAQGLEPGTYEAEVQVLDEAFGTVSTVPVTLIVEEPPVNPTVQKLNLTSMCSDDPTTELRWRIRNPNDFAVDVTWQVYGSTQSATVSAPAGDSFFFTDTEPGANTTIIRWQNEEGKTKQKIKASGKAPCQPPVVEPSVTVFPNPVQGEFTIKIDGGAAPGKLFIWDEGYRSVLSGSEDPSIPVDPNSELTLDANALGLESDKMYYIWVEIPTANGEVKVINQKIIKN